MRVSRIPRESQKYSCRRRCVHISIPFSTQSYTFEVSSIEQLLFDVRTFHDGIPKKGEPALIFWRPNPGFIPKPFDVSEFHSHFCHSREGDTLEFEVSFEIRPLFGVGKVVNWA